MDLQHIAVKLFTRDVSAFDMASLIPIFHRWIQRTALSDLMLIDVADYTHVHEGPGVILICHEGHFAMDEGEGRLGLLYSNKRLATGDVQQRFRTAVQRTLSAAKLLEAEPELGGKIAFATNELLFRVDDRLLAPNTTETYQRLKPDMERVLVGTYDGEAVDLRHIEDPRTSFTVKATTSTSPDLETLLARLQASNP